MHNVDIQKLQWFTEDTNCLLALCSSEETLNKGLCTRIREYCIHLRDKKMFCFVFLINGSIMSALKNKDLYFIRTIFFVTSENIFLTRAHHLQEVKAELFGAAHIQTTSWGNMSHIKTQSFVKNLY